MPVFRGGGGIDSGRLYGRYAGAVYNSRFEDWPCGLEVESNREA